MPGKARCWRLIETGDRCQTDRDGQASSHISTKWRSSACSAVPAQTLVLGDRLETDILGAVRLSLKSALVLSGVTTREQLAASDYQPDWVFDDITDLRPGEKTAVRRRSGPFISVARVQIRSMVRGRSAGSSVNMRCAKVLEGCRGQRFFVAKNAGDPIPVVFLLAVGLGDILDQIGGQRAEIFRSAVLSARRAWTLARTAGSKVLRSPARKALRT